MPVINDFQRWSPPRFFYSHATKDIKLRKIIHDCLISKNYDIYFAERTLVGKPLIEKLRDEMLSCNAILVGWTNGMSNKHIISFELGMGYSLGLPIFLLLADKDNKGMPWFFDKITDYERINPITQNNIIAAINKMDPFSFIDPIDIIIPQDPSNPLYPLPSDNKNQQVVNNDGSLSLWDDFNFTLRLSIINNIKKPIKNLRYKFYTSGNFKMEVTPGDIYGTSRTLRNENYSMWPPSLSCNELNWYWDSFPAMKMIFDIRFRIMGTCHEVPLIIRYTTDKTIGWKSKSIPIKRITHP